MMTSPASRSDNDSSSFERLSPGVKRWIHDVEWPFLRPVQEIAIPIILDAEADLIISAPTAGGKTEAAFLPVVSALETAASEATLAGIGALYIGPLKALINDQARRLEDICKHAKVQVTAWHGDVSATKKKKLIELPSGVLMITPESMEAFFILRGPEMKRLFAALKYVVIDEIHAFVGQERGRQLQSQLVRLERVLRRRIPRIGLSATIGNMDLVKDFIRRGEGGAVETASPSEGSSQEIQLRLRGYLRKRIKPVSKDGQPSDEPLGVGDNEVDEGGDTTDEVAITRHLFRNLRGHNNLIFANSRSEVESIGDRLRRMSELERVPVEFFPHHGSLHKSLREELEARLKRGNEPVSAVCTTTLEMGIDLGEVKSVAQVGAPSSVSSFTQRLGRSGRRGDPAVMRLYVRENELDPRLELEEQLRFETVQSAAVVKLLVEKSFEPPSFGQFHFSTMVQQLISLIAQYGGVQAADAYGLLCKEGPFREVSSGHFGDLLRSLGRHELISQMENGELVIGFKGEQLVGHYDFYAAFASSDEYVIRTSSKNLGTLPVNQSLEVGGLIVFAARRWKLVDVDQERRILLVQPHTGGRTPRFDGRGPTVHEIVRREMQAVLESNQEVPFLNPTAAKLLREGRATYRDYKLRVSKIVIEGSNVFLLPFAGDLAVNTLHHAFSGAKICDSVGVSQGILHLTKTTELTVKNALEDWAGGGLPSDRELASRAASLAREKHDHYLDDELLVDEYVARSLDSVNALHAVRRLLRR